MISKIETYRLKSMSVRPEEVCALELKPGEEILCKGKTYSWDKPTVLMVDRLRFRHGAYRTTMIRQALELDHPGWGQDYAKPHKAARVWAQKAGMPRVTVPGGIPPLTIEGTIALPDFSMSGTSWYILPEQAIANFDLNVHFGGCDDD